MATVDMDTADMDEAMAGMVVDTATVATDEGMEDMVDMDTIEYVNGPMPSRAFEKHGR